jgi:hypothetical protein
MFNRLPEPKLLPSFAVRSSIVRNAKLVAQSGPETRCAIAGGPSKSNVAVSDASAVPLATKHTVQIRENVPKLEVLAPLERELLLGLA